MKRFCLVLLLWPIVTLSAQVSFTVIEAVRLPVESFVGDAVELRYSIRSSYQPSDVQTPSDLPWGTVQSLRITPRDDGFEVRVVVVPYESGTLTLPVLDLGEIRLEGLSFVVSSVLEGDDSLRPIHEPQYLPGTRSLAAILLLCLLLVPAAAIYLLGPGRRHVGALYARYRARLPHRRLMRRLGTLESSVERMSGKEFYVDLVAELQMFMGLRLGRDCMSQTSTELTMTLPDLARSCGALSDTTAVLAEVFSVADSVKFAHRRIRRSVWGEQIRMVRGVAEVLETSRRRFRRRRTRRRRILRLLRNRAAEASSVGV